MSKSTYNHPVNILPHKGEVFLYPGFFSPGESNKLYKELMETVPWKQEPIKIFGKEIMQPRLTAWYANPGIFYSYSGITMQGFDWNKPLLLIKERIEDFFRLSCNSALLNLYRDGNDSMGWHRDNEKELGRHPLIVSVSFGASRKFQLREYKTKENLISLDLEHGSVLIMKGESQPHWEHRVPKQPKLQEPRINITFRVVLQSPDTRVKNQESRPEPSINKNPK